MAELVLTGYRYSVYTRAARMALIEKGLDFTEIEADPFDAPPDPLLARLTPFGRVPVLRHGDFILYETAAITRYADALGGAPSLVPEVPEAAARMAQVIGIVDSYGYAALVRQVYAGAVFRVFEGGEADHAAVAAGLSASGPVLDALEAIASEGLQLDGRAVSLADLHLAPMIACFEAAGPGRAMLARYPKLSAWFARVSGRGSFRATDRALARA